MPPGFSLESGVRRDAAGRWFHEGEPVVNEGVARAFDRWIDRHEDGRYILRNSVNWAYFELEGPPLFVRGITITEGGILLALSNGLEEQLVPDTLRQDAAGNLYCDAAEGRLVAQLLRKATLQLEPLVDEDEQGIFLHIGGRRIRPPEVEDPLEP